MTFSFLDGWWTDAGTFDSLLRATNLVAQSVLRKESGQEAVEAGGAGVTAASGTARNPSAIWNWRSRFAKRESAR